MTVSTDERADLVKLIAALLDHLTPLETAYFTTPYQNLRYRNCLKVRRKLFELLDDSGEPK